jgi:solute carrier family 45, member 1/2/4
MTKACCEACANLKGAFFIAMVSVELQTSRLFSFHALTRKTQLLELNSIHFQILLLISVAVTVIFANEVPLSEIEAAALETGLTSEGTVIEIESPIKEEKDGIFNFFQSFKNLPPGMLSVLLVTCLTWVIEKSTKKQIIGLL